MKLVEPSYPAWIYCPCCDNCLCTIHWEHAFECPCPPIEEWTTDPYNEGGNPLPLELKLAFLEKTQPAPRPPAFPPSD